MGIVAIASLVVVFVVVVFVVGRIVVRLAMRAAARKLLTSVGAKALERLPDRISVTAAPNHSWSSSTADSYARDLLDLGFEDAGTFAVDQLDGVYVRLLAHETERIAAAVYEHPKTGVWFDLFKHYADGRSVTHTTTRSRGLERRPGTRVEHEPGATPARLFERIRAEHDEGELLAMTTANVAERFSDACTRDCEWRKHKGISTAEVARVARSR